MENQFFQVNYSGDKINPRCGHTTNVYQNKLYISGGFTENPLFGSTPDFFEYNLITQEMKQRENNFEHARQLHTSIIHNDIIYSFFGSRSFHLNLIYTDRYPDEIVSYNLKKNTWKLIETKGICKPNPRFKHSCVKIGSVIFIFGGCFPIGLIFFDDMWKMDLDQNFKWEEVNQKNRIEARMAHGCINHQTDIYVFGGKNIVDRCNDLYKFDTINCLWTNLPKNGDVPIKRAGCTLNFYENSIYLFGGFNGEVDMNDLHVYDLNFMKWKKIEMKNEIKGRSFYSITLIENERSPYFIIFGGIYEKNQKKENFNDMQNVKIRNENIFYNLMKIRMYQDVIIKFSN